MNNDKVMKPGVVLNGNSNNTIRHSVVFRFNEGMNELEKQQFFYAITKLTAINGVEKFEILKQVSIKNKFEYGISMEFKNEEGYQYYNNHPDHVAFVQNIWLRNVEDFLEIDYKALD